MKVNATLRPILAGLVLVLLPAAAAAQGGPRTDVTVVPGDVLFDPPSQLEFIVGWTEQSVVVTLTPRHPNRQNWSLHLRALAADMGVWGKPVEEIQVWVDGTGPWALTTDDQIVATGTGLTTLVVVFRLSLNWTFDVPGSYSVPFEFSSTTL